ncbi:hypothetical protein [Bradyrhizobium sp. DOA9]|uniref:hypothetical protein n=1 Tax=Bradyrhizobium sp. DOA9 TaxID=1126627 RepID=UPI000723685E|nr:hypothetical protein [Bradyrhizobium sp. DOA9]GAJ34514.1 hypothetical protein BDOA9_0137120 [Bradyrhizobium sp. DOA9]
MSSALLRRNLPQFVPACSKTMQGGSAPAALAGHCRAATPRHNVSTELSHNPRWFTAKTKFRREIEMIVPAVKIVIGEGVTPRPTKHASQGVVLHQELP